MSLDPVYCALLDQIKTSPELRKKLESVDLGHAQDPYDKAREQFEIW